MTEKQRDFGLDVLKGVGCLLMVVAHSNLNFKGYAPYTFWAGLAPVLFYAVAGVTASFQAEKYRPRGVLLTYAFMLLLGFSFNRITDPAWLEEINFDIIQLIAVGASVIYLMERYWKPPAWLYLALVPAAFFVKFPFMDWLDGRFVPGVTGILIPPAIFSVFPWLFLFFLGVFAYRVRNIYNLVFGIAAFGFFYIFYAPGFNLENHNKWNMSFSYFLVCCALVFLSFYLVRAVDFLRQRHGLALLVFLGQNSLLFLYVHFPLVLALKEQRIHRTVKVVFRNPYLFWLLVLAITVVVMLVILWLAKVKLFQKPFQFLPTWILMVAAVFAMGYFFPGRLREYWGQIGIGVLFATFYPYLSALLKQSSGSIENNP
ncbi:MAG: hypothetical protein Kow002_18910 [Anaerolineales bacterium]